MFYHYCLGLVCKVCFKTVLAKYLLLFSVIFVKPRITTVVTMLTCWRRAVKVTDRQTFTGDNVNVLLCVVVGRGVRGVTLLHDIVYIVCEWSSSIIRFDAVTHRRLADIIVKDMSQPRDIAACQQTAQLYVAHHGCVWRVSSDGKEVKRLLPKSPSDTISPWALSVTSSRLLVTSHYTNQLRQFDAVGDELSRVDLPRDMDPLHAVESPTGTFIVSHENTQQLEYHVSEVDTGGQVLRQFSGSLFGFTPHVAVDSQGNIFVADWGAGHILMLNSELTLRRVIIDEHQLNYNYKRPWRLCYTEQSGQLMVGFLNDRDVAVFDVLRR